MLIVWLVTVSPKLNYT